MQPTVRRILFTYRDIGDLTHKNLLNPQNRFQRYYAACTLTANKSEQEQGTLRRPGIWHQKFFYLASKCAKEALKWQPIYFRWHFPMLEMHFVSLYWENYLAFQVPQRKLLVGVNTENSTHTSTADSIQQLDVLHKICRSQMMQPFFLHCQNISWPQTTQMYVPHKSTVGYIFSLEIQHITWDTLSLCSKDYFRRSFGIQVWIHWDMLSMPAK